MKDMYIEKDGNIKVIKVPNNYKTKDMLFYDEKNGKIKIIKVPDNYIWEHLLIPANMGRMSIKPKGKKDREKE